MKRVEPLVKIDHPVLDYEAHYPRTWWQQAWDRLVDLQTLLGTGGAMFVGMVLCIGFGLSLTRVGGGIPIIVGAILGRLWLGYWARSSRW